MKRTLLLSLFTAAAAWAGDFTGTAGLQLYSLRDAFKADVPGSLEKVKAMGIREVELAGTYGQPPEAFLHELTSRGLKPVSAHYQYGVLEKELPRVIEEARALGLKYVACPWIPHTEAEFDMATAKKAAADFNRWGAELKRAGITFAYHNHGYEFKPVTEGAEQTFLDVLMAETNPEFVAFEMDVFWVVHPGADPVKWLQKYPGRWQLMHLKDIVKGARTGVYTGHAPNEQSAILGTGQVQWQAILPIAAKVGVKHYFIEDEHQNAEQQIPESLRFLEALK